MMIRFCIIFILTFSCSVKSVLSQGCKDEVIKVLANMQNYSNEMSIAFLYDVEMAFSKADSSQNTSVKLLARSDHFAMHAGDMEMYQNDKYNIIVIRDRKQVYITHAKKKEILPLETISDSLIAKSSVLICERKCMDDSKNKEQDHIVISFDDITKRTLNIKSAEYWIIPESLQVTKFKIDYNEKKQMDYLILNIKEYNRNYTGAIFGSEIQVIMNDPDQVLRIFPDYLIKDNR